jgi:hypothetical protein
MVPLNQSLDTEEMSIESHEQNFEADLKEPLPHTAISRHQAHRANTRRYANITRKPVRQKTALAIQVAKIAVFRSQS